MKLFLRLGRLMSFIYIKKYDSALSYQNSILLHVFSVLERHYNVFLSGVVSLKRFKCCLIPIFDFGKPY